MGAKIALLSALFVAFLLFGCAQESSKNGSLKEEGKQKEAAFLVPQSRWAYAAHYVINEDGQEAAKVVYRMGRMARIDYMADLQSSEPFLSLYFLSDKAYSCARSIEGRKCFDITSLAAQHGADAYLRVPDLKAAKKAERVQVGSGELYADCYIFSEFPMPERKMCLIDGSIIAYDEHAISGKRHTEYLSNLRLGANESQFALPAPPEPAGSLNFSSQIFLG